MDNTGYCNISNYDGKEGKIGKYTTKSIIVEINEPKTSNKNNKVKKVHECIKYERDKLTEIALKCRHDKCFKIINKGTCVKIREYRPNRNYVKRGNRLKLHLEKQKNSITLST